MHIEVLSFPIAGPCSASHQSVPKQRLWRSIQRMFRVIRIAVLLPLSLSVCSDLFSQEPPVTMAPSNSAVIDFCFYEEEWQTPISGMLVTFTFQPQPYSGYHQHDSVGRPGGTVDPASVTTDSYGCAGTSYTAPQFAGIVHVIGTGQFELGEATGTVVIHVNALCCVELGPGVHYTLVGDTPQHPQNHNGTLNVNSRMGDIAQQFYQQTSIRIRINDMSLNWGGLFDIGRPYGVFWQSPHNEHRWGLNVDVGTSNLGNYRNLFYNIAAMNGAADGGPILDEGDHFHLRFAY